MLRDFTHELEKIESVGQGHCSGCEFRTEDGYLVRGPELCEFDKANLRQMSMDEYKN